MTALQPCGTCSLQRGCEVRAEKLAAIKGLGFTWARFRCAKVLEAYRPGRRVLATITAGIDDGEYRSDAHVKATVIRASSFRRGRFVVWIDADQMEDLSLKDERGLCSLTPRKLKLLEEPDQPERVAELEAMDREQMGSAFE